MRVLVARCTVDYDGRLTAHLPEATRLLMVKADGCVAIHADGGAYKPLNWMVAPNTLTEEPASGEDAAKWVVTNPKGETLTIQLHDVISDTSYEFGEDPGLSKDGVEAHLQQLLANNPEALGEGYTLVRREFPTDIGPVDLLLRDAQGNAVAVEIKRRGEIDGVEQLTRYLERMKRDPMLNGLRGIFAAQIIKPQAKVLAASRDIQCIEVDYDELRGIDSGELKLF
ncbi:endonuclease NucS [Stomatohabitans albus]|uniref:endonuclease NucS n=1 Tax=Stomatohabitans albus TaxID=3110766 RepID=UPI00300CD882